MRDDDPRQHHHRGPRSGEDHRDPPPHLPAPGQRAVGHRGERVRRARHRRRYLGHGGRALQGGRGRVLQGRRRDHRQGGRGGMPLLRGRRAVHRRRDPAPPTRQARPPHHRTLRHGPPRGPARRAPGRTPREGPAHRRDDRARRHDAGGAGGRFGGVGGVQGSGPVRRRRRRSQGRRRHRRRSVPIHRLGADALPAQARGARHRERGTAPGRLKHPAGHLGRGIGGVQTDADVVARAAGDAAGGDAAGGDAAGGDTGGGERVRRRRR